MSVYHIPSKKTTKEKAKRENGKLGRHLSLLERTALFDDTFNHDGLRLNLLGIGSIRETMWTLRKQEECNRLIKERNRISP